MAGSRGIDQADPLPLVPYALLSDGSIVLGKKTRISGKQSAAIVNAVTV